MIVCESLGVQSIRRHEDLLTFHLRDARELIGSLLRSLVISAMDISRGCSRLFDNTNPNEANTFVHKY